MQEIVLGSRKMNRGEQVAAIVCGALLMYHATAFTLGILWYVFVLVYVTLLFFMLLRTQRFVIISGTGIEYKPNPIGSVQETAWSSIRKITSNSQGVTLHLTNGSNVEFKSERSKWFNFRKFRINIERYATTLNIPVLISFTEVGVEPPPRKSLPE